MSKMNSRPKKLRILTVGDGDLSFSLALLRAYGNNYIESFAATTLIESKESLVVTYENSSEIYSEITATATKMANNKQVIFGVDATKLEENKDVLSSGPHDIIMFNHPHLGRSELDSDNSENKNKYETESNSNMTGDKRHALRHRSLLCHYFYSAKKLLLANKNQSSGRIHVCLCGSQPKTWDLLGSASHIGLKLEQETKTSTPVHEWLFDKDNGVTPNEVKEHYKAPRRYRNGRLGSRHYLGRYGYRHRRTNGDNYRGNDMDINVENSINFVFSVLAGDKVEEGDLQSTKSSPAASKITCDICGISFPTTKKLEGHMRSSAIPDIILDDNKKHKIIESKTKEPDKKDDILVNISSGQQNIDGTNNNDNVLVQSLVSLEQDGKRLRWYCHYCSTNSLWLLTSTTAATFTTDSNIHHSSRKIETITTNGLVEAAATKISNKRKRGQNNHGNGVVNTTKVKIKSKKEWNECIKAGRVKVNGIVAMDTSRILKNGDIVSVLREERKKEVNTNIIIKESDNTGDKKTNQIIRDNQKTTANNNEESSNLYCGDDTNINDTVNLKNSRQDVHIVDFIPISSSSFNSNSTVKNLMVVAYKPVGCRVIGSFSNRTLEMIVADLFMKSVRRIRDQAMDTNTNNNVDNILSCFDKSDGNSSFINNIISDDCKCDALSKLDTGCAGLVVLLLTTKIKTNNESERTTTKISLQNNNNNIIDSPNSIISDRNKTTKGSNIQALNHNMDVTIKIKKLFCALLHGHVPKEWDDGVIIKIAKHKLQSSQSWKKKTKTQKSIAETNYDNQSIDESNHPNSLVEIIPVSSTFNLQSVYDDDTRDDDKKYEYLFIQCTQRTSTIAIGEEKEMKLDENVKRMSSISDNIDKDQQKKRTLPKLSSVKIAYCIKNNPHSKPSQSTLPPSFTFFSVKNILYILRKELKYPVVNDFYCKQKEFSSLPRLMKNIVKNKLCILCYEVHVEQDLVSDGGMFIKKEEENGGESNRGRNKEARFHYNPHHQFVSKLHSFLLPERLSCKYWEKILL